MPTYVSLLKLSHQGITTIKDGPSRLDSAREILRSFGAEIKDFYFTMGQYDIIVVTEAPDDAAVAKGLLAIASGGNVTTQTLRAFKEDEYREIVNAVQPMSAHPAVAAVEIVRQKLVESLDELQKALRRD
jgi:uncharacterized protein with GYD domain